MKGFIFASALTLGSCVPATCQPDPGPVDPPVTTVTVTVPEATTTTSVDTATTVVETTVPDTTTSVTIGSTTTVAETTTTATVPPVVELDDVRTNPYGAPGFYSDGVGAFRTICLPSHRANDDPIVFPGRPGASHLHEFFGNANTDAYSTTMVSTALSSCPGGTANQSGYWVPAMLDDGVPVDPSYLIVYYKSGYRGVPASAVRPFPAGLRIVAGNARATERDPSPWYDRHVSWSCADDSTGGKPPADAEMVPCDRNRFVVMAVEFPQCWDGVNLDSADHQSHMAYADDEAGGCPASHPVPLATISFNMYWRVTTDTVGWRLVSDMYDGPAGRSGHGDWWNGWNPDIEAAWLASCVNAGLDCGVNNLGDGRRLE
jgi:hypothetical protein